MVAVATVSGSKIYVWLFWEYFNSSCWFKCCWQLYYLYAMTDTDKPQRGGRATGMYRSLWAWMAVTA